MIEYDEFITLLNTTISTHESFYYNLIKTIIQNPNRYTGIFRLTNAKTKLIQNVTQSQEIKFGDFMEEIITLYICRMGYTNLPKNIGTDEYNNPLNADQVFIKNDYVYLIEQKIRDDHDSTKKRGQIQNFQKKYTLLQKLYPNKKISASMWFIDANLKKNKKYYETEIKNYQATNLELNIFYGEDLFKILFKRMDIWNELCSHLTKNKKERSNNIISIPDFNTNQEILEILKKIKINEPYLIKKLKSDKPEYVALKEELFSDVINLI